MRLQTTSSTPGVSSPIGVCGTREGSPLTSCQVLLLPRGQCAENHGPAATRAQRATFSRPSQRGSDTRHLRALLLVGTHMTPLDARLGNVVPRAGPFTLDKRHGAGISVLTSQPLPHQRIPRRRPFAEHPVKARGFHVFKLYPPVGGRGGISTPPDSAPVLGPAQMVLFQTHRP